MPSFSKKISISGCIYTFIFTLIYTVDGMRYFVEVKDKESKVHQFFMKPIERSWIIINTQKIPEWLTALEVQLEEVILKY